MINVSHLFFFALNVAVFWLKIDGKSKVYRLFVNDAFKLKTIRNLTSTFDPELDVWKRANEIGDFSDVVVVTPKRNEFFVDLFQKNGLNYSIIVDDLEKLIKDENRRTSKTVNTLKDLPFSKFRRTLPPFDLSSYHTYNEIIKYLQDLHKAFPTITNLTVLGHTHRNRPIYTMQIGKTKIDLQSKHAIWIDAGIHAREWLSVSTAVFFIYSLLSGYGKDPKITKYVDNLDWYITPVINVDGYEYTQSSPKPHVRLWRKSMSPNIGSCKKVFDCCAGVDLNRNFDFSWGGQGSSNKPCSQTYRGPSPFSEPETKAVRDFLMRPDIKPNVKAFITLHTYSQMWFFPYGHQKGLYPKDVGDLKLVSEKAIRKIQGVYGTQYETGTAADLLYEASGCSEDWAKHNVGVKYSYLLELRPSGEKPRGFVVHRSEIIPTGRETWEGIKVIADAVIRDQR